MVVAAGSRKLAPVEPVQCNSQASPSAGSPNRPSIHYRERGSSMKNRKREIRTSGSVRDGGGATPSSTRPTKTISAFRRRRGSAAACVSFRIGTNTTIDPGCYPPHYAWDVGGTVPKSSPRPIIEFAGRQRVILCGRRRRWRRSPPRGSGHRHPRDRYDFYHTRS